MNRLFVVDKPIFQSSNGYMRHIKRKYGTKKAGFSGTLDPFATGCLIVATGQYTKLFQYLAKTPKTYRAALWLGARSPSLDLENVVQITPVPPVPVGTIRDVLDALRGEQTYLPPKFSAKNIHGQRAYTLAREGKAVPLQPTTSTVYAVELLGYTHPFVHFEITVSEGSYIRSFGSMIAERLGVDGTLSSLRRIREGRFVMENERALDPFDHLTIPRNTYTGDAAALALGQPCSIDDFTTQSNGTYLVETARFFAIMEIRDGAVRYRLNRLAKFVNPSASPH